MWCHSTVSWEGTGITGSQEPMWGKWPLSACHSKQETLQWVSFPLCHKVHTLLALPTKKLSMTGGPCPPPRPSPPTLCSLTASEFWLNSTKFTPTSASSNLPFPRSPCHLGRYSERSSLTTLPEVATPSLVQYIIWFNFTHSPWYRLNLPCLFILSLHQNLNSMSSDTCLSMAIPALNKYSVSICWILIN